MNLSGTIDSSLTALLADDHRRIHHLLEDLAAMLDDGELERAAHHFADLDDALRRHMVAEEELLFPAFVRRTGHDRPPTVMRMEHRELEGFLDGLGHSLAVGPARVARAALASLVALLSAHDEKEERVLYPACDRSLSGEERARLHEAVRRAIGR